MNSNTKVIELLSEDTIKNIERQLSLLNHSYYLRGILLRKKIKFIIVKAYKQETFRYVRINFLTINSFFAKK